MGTKTPPESAESEYLECYGIERMILEWVWTLRGTRKTKPILILAIEKKCQGDLRDPGDRAPDIGVVYGGIKSLLARRWLRRSKEEFLTTKRGRAALGIDPALPRKVGHAKDDMQEVIGKGVAPDLLQRSTNLIFSTLKAIREEAKFRFDPRVNSRGEIPDCELLTWALHKGIPPRVSKAVCGRLLLERRIRIAITPATELISVRDGSVGRQDEETTVSIDRTGVCATAVLDLLSECEESVEDRINRIPVGGLRGAELAMQRETPFPSHGLPRTRLETALTKLFPDLKVHDDGPRSFGLNCPAALQTALRESRNRYGDKKITFYFRALPFPETGTYAESIVSLLEAERISVSAWIPMDSPFGGPVFRTPPPLRSRGWPPNKELELFTISSICARAEISAGTFRKYAHLAGLPRAGQGQRNFTYTHDQVEHLLQTILSRSSDSSLQRRCERALEKLKQRTKKPQSHK